MLNKRQFHLIIVLLVLFGSSTLSARGFRSFDAIVVAPQAALEGEALATPRAVSSAAIRAGVETIIASWNGPALERVLADQFYDRHRLLDAIDTHVPRNATLRLISLQGAQVIRQRQRAAQQQSAAALISDISVTVNTQLEYRDQQGLRSFPGSFELVIRLTQPLVAE